jgi:4-alpha-glucanotransferase
VSRIPRGPVVIELKKKSMNDELEILHPGLPQRRLGGVCLHLASLPGIYGIGDIGDGAKWFMDQLSQMNLGVWQFLPTGPTAYGDSPYQPLSSFAGNEMLIDIAGLIRMGLISSVDADSLLGLPEERVDYGRLIPKKKTLLDKAAACFLAEADDMLQDAYARFLEDNDDRWLHDYALFRVLKTEHALRPWQDWEEKFRKRDPHALQEFAHSHAAGINAVKVQQFLFDYQWADLRRYAAGKQITLFGDMPIYLALDSADAWAHPEILRLDADGRPTHVAGVPPDYFSEDGQLWGNPLYDWEYHAATGYSWWIDRIRAAARQVDIVRIDHFRGFESFWEVPADASTARQGRWVAGPGDGIFDAIHNALGRLPIVAEDLGVITPEVEALRDRHQLPGMVVLQFELPVDGFSLDSISRNCVCYTGTHDNDTTLGWFTGSPDDNRSQNQIIETRRRVLAFTGTDKETVAWDVIRLAFSSPARMAIAPMQDFLGLGSDARLNRPGTSSGNWSWRLSSARLTPELCRATREVVRACDRVPGGK